MERLIGLNSIHCKESESMCDMNDVGTGTQFDGKTEVPDSHCFTLLHWYLAWLSNGAKLRLELDFTENLYGVKCHTGTENMILFL